MNAPTTAHARESLRLLVEFTGDLVRRLTVDTADVASRDRLFDDVLEAFAVQAASVVVDEPEGPVFLCRPADLKPLERVQHQGREGPSHRAATSGEVVVVPDLRTMAADWPTYVPVATAVGMRSAVAVPLVVDGEPVGAFSLYRTDGRACTEVEIGFAVVVADILSGFVTNARAYREQETVVRQLQTALDSRVVLEQAKGMVAAANGIDVGAAFDRLRSHARSHNRTLASVAQLVVDRDLRL